MQERQQEVNPFSDMPKERLIGCHVSIADGFYYAVKAEQHYGGNVMMCLTGPPRNQKRRDLSRLDIPRGVAALEPSGVKQVVIHAPYFIQLSSNDKEWWRESQNLLIEELNRAEALMADYLVVHPGSHTQGTYYDGLRNLAAALDNVIDRSPSYVKIILETMVGKGKEIGDRFEEFQTVFDMMHYSKEVGVCIDTCHIHDAGYDLRMTDLLIDIIDDILGLDRVPVVHVNGSLNERGARKDKHAGIFEAKSKIDPEGIINFVHHPKTSHMSFLLETCGMFGWKHDVGLLRSMGLH